MKKAKNIHNLDTLDSEIYRLKLEAKNIEQKLDRNFENLEENYSSIMMNSFFRKKKDSGDGKNSFFSSFFSNGTFSVAINRVIDLIAERLAEGIDSLADKIFHKGK